MGAFTKIFQRLKLTADTNVSTQTTTVIAADTTNSNIAIVPNGTGALIADIPDGTPTGGNARGSYCVDLQMSRNAADQVAGFNFDTITGGERNKISANFDGYRFIGGGYTNTISAAGYSVIAGGSSNTITGGGSSFNTISGGSGNSASSSYSTVVGGYSNTASGSAAIAGGSSNTASGNSSIALGFQSVSSALESIAINRGTASGQNSLALQQATASGNYAFATTLGNASGQYSVALGRFTIANSLASFAGPYSESRAVGAAALCEGVAYGNSSFVAGQYSQSQATAPNSSVFGLTSNAYLQGQNTNASGNFAAIGDAQQSNLTARREATLASNATTVLSLDGTGVTNLLIPLGNNRVWAVKVVATAVVSYALPFMTLGDSYMAEYTLLFKKMGGVSSVVGVIASNVIFNTNMVDASFSFAAGASQDLQITFKAPSISGNSIYRCVARVELTEVTY